MLKTLRHFLVFFSLPLFAAPVPSVSLREVFQSALQKNETLKIQEASRIQAEEKVSQAGGSILPHLALNGNYQRQDSPKGTTSNIARPDQYTGRITLTQPIFHGLSEYAVWNQYKAKLRSEQSLETQTKLNLYANTAENFFTSLSAEKDLADTKVLFDLTTQRIKELKQRAKIGRSRKGDLLSAEAQVASVTAQVELAEVTFKQARENLKFVTGIGTDVPLKDAEESLTKSTPSLELYLNMIEKRPDIIAYREDVDAADEGVAAARGGHLPTIDAVGNYYLFRTGFLQDAKWDAGITLSIPIFSGGVTQSQVREATEQRKTKELQLAQARRNAEKDIRMHFANYKSSVAQFAALEQALNLAEANYKEQSKDYRYGLVTNLEVLTALNSLQETRRSYNRTLYQGRIALISLQTSTGQMPAEKE